MLSKFMEESVGTSSKPVPLPTADLSYEITYGLVGVVLPQ